MSQDQELREDGKFVIDFQGRKVCIFPNMSGEVILMVEDFGERTYTACRHDEIPAICAALMRAAAEAKPVAEAMDAEYGAFAAIEQAKGS